MVLVFMVATPNIAPVQQQLRERISSAPLAGRSLMEGKYKVKTLSKWYTSYGAIPAAFFS